MVLVLLFTGAYGDKNVSAPPEGSLAVDLAYSDLINELAAANNGNAWQTFDQIFDMNMVIRKDITNHNKINFVSMLETWVPTLLSSLAGALLGSGIAGTLVGFMVAFVFAPNNSVMENLVTALISHLEAYVRTQLVNLEMARIQQQIDGILNQLLFQGVTDWGLGQMYFLAPSFFGSCWREGTSAVSCEDWQQAGSIFYTLQFSFLHAGFIMESSRQALDRGDTTASDGFLTDLENVANQYWPLLSNSMHNWTSFRLSEVVPPRVVGWPAPHGWGDVRTLDPPRDNFRNIDVQCYDANGSPLRTRLTYRDDDAGRAQRDTFINSWLNCYGDYFNSLLPPMRDLANQLNLFWLYTQPAGASSLSNTSRQILDLLEKMEPSPAMLYGEVGN